MTAIEIEDMLVRERWRHGTTMPRYTPGQWWECDVAELTKAGYLREYEIKLSRQDFRADAHKEAYFNHDRKNKHELLAQRSPVGPCQFWFVAPANVLPLSIIPEWAGLYEIRKDDRAWARPYLYEVRPAPRLHSTPAPQAVRDHMVGVAYYRFHRLASQHRRMQQATVKHAKLLRAFGWPKVKPSPR